MQTLEITSEKAKQLYPDAEGDFKEMLEEKFGKKFLSGKFIDDIETFDDIIRLAGVHPDDYRPRNDETVDELAYRHAKLIAKVYNRGSVLDAGNTEQYKYFPWHVITKDKSKPSGFGLSYHGYDGWHTHSDVGVRLCFLRSEDAIDAGKKFIEIYENLKVR